MNVNKVVTMKEGESVLLIVRRFSLTYSFHLLLSFVLICAPFFFMIPLFSLHGWGLAAFLTSVLVGLLYSARLYREWYWNSFVITTRRVIDIDQIGFFKRTVSEAPYERVQDVSFTIEGVLGTLFKYGTIVVQTAGTHVNLELIYVHQPQKIHHLITETASALQAESNGGVRSQKVAHLLDTAADLSDAEARAFLVALQEAVSHGGKEHKFQTRPLEMIMNPDDDDRVADSPVDQLEN
ncbi:MAG: PH domain-containing protein [Patescibacteria group bacterium]